MALIKYHYAYDESKQVININDVSSIERSKHSYYCVGCGAEMIPRLGKIKVIIYELTTLTHYVCSHWSLIAFRCPFLSVATPGKCSQFDHAQNRMGNTRYPKYNHSPPNLAFPKDFSGTHSPTHAYIPYTFSEFSHPANCTLRQLSNFQNSFRSLFFVYNCVKNVP